MIKIAPKALLIIGFFLVENFNEAKAFVMGVFSDSIVEYAVGGSLSDPKLRSFPYNYILIWKLIEEAKARGALILDMGGITDESESDPLAGISRFKRYFPGFETRIGCEGLIRIKTLHYFLFFFLQKCRIFFGVKHLIVNLKVILRLG